ncbi:hypothetical protein L6164_000071 [Bauhinia variegata]|uniref:Uncharacterized protein n=1 Tax=Bauhinia variegata TaxID=167791 RepID=A0ACB9Q5E2_BAUVA|nr:hypothetical protein L6164_000071 [Bauhinia variegata]
MIALKPIHPSFSSSKHAPYWARLSSSAARTSMLCLCKSNESDSQTPPPEGDRRSQELLAQIAMLQAQKVRLTDYLDERSAYLTQFGEEANAEFDKVGEEALKELDEASARIAANIESQMLEFEESAELNREEIQKSENNLVEFEGQIEKDKNEGMFFKNLGQKPPVVDKAKAREEAEKIKDVTKEKAGSKIRRTIYLFFIGLLTVGIVNSIASSSTDWKKVAFLGAIVVALFFQFIYEQKLSSETRTTEERSKEEENK